MFHGGALQKLFLTTIKVCCVRELEKTKIACRGDKNLLCALGLVMYSLDITGIFEFKDGLAAPFAALVGQGKYYVFLICDQEKYLHFQGKNAEKSGLRFAYRGAKIWNSLPNDCRKSNTFPTFKRKLEAKMA